MSLKLMIDSASDIDQKEADEKGIILMPIEVKIKDEDYLDGVNLTAQEFYKKLVENSELPKTSQINPYRWEQALDEATENGDEVIVITLSSRLSGTYQSAKSAEDKYNGKVRVIDSMNACSGEKLLALLAIDLINQGLSLNEIVEKLEIEKNNIQVMAIVDTLKYLKRGGRINAMTAIAGEVFSVKPIIGVLDGQVKMIGKAMGIKKAFSTLNTMITSIGIDFNKPHCVMYSGCDDSNLNKFVSENASIWNGDVSKLNKYIIGSTIGTHVGPGAVGIAFFKK